MRIVALITTALVFLTIGYVIGHRVAREQRDDRLYFDGVDERFNMPGVLLPRTTSGPTTLVYP